MWITSCDCVVLRNIAYYWIAYFFICIAPTEIGNFISSMAMECQVPKNK